MARPPDEHKPEDDFPGVPCWRNFLHRLRAQPYRERLGLHDRQGLRLVDAIGTAVHIGYCSTSVGRAASFCLQDSQQDSRKRVHHRTREWASHHGATTSTKEKKAADDEEDGEEEVDADFDEDCEDQEIVVDTDVDTDIEGASSSEEGENEESDEDTGKQKLTLPVKDTAPLIAKPRQSHRIIWDNGYFFVPEVDTRGKHLV